MPHFIDDSCTNCSRCEAECPLEAISEKGSKRVINANVCVDCGACAAVCDEGAISEEAL
jgi:heterodisulfide reductase subunit A-like polyferredoxin